MMCQLTVLMARQKGLRERERMVAALKKQNLELAARLTDVKGEVSDELKQQINTLTQAVQAANTERDRLILDRCERRRPLAEFKASELKHRQETAVQLSTQKEKIRLLGVTIEQLQAQASTVRTCGPAMIGAQLGEFLGNKGVHEARDDELFRLRAQVLSQQERIAELERDLAVRLLLPAATNMMVAVRLQKKRWRASCRSITRPRGGPPCSSRCGGGHMPHADSAQSVVSDTKANYEKLKERVTEDAKTLTELRASVLERDVAIKRLTEQVGNEVSAWQLNRAW